VKQVQKCISEQKKGGKENDNAEKIDFSTVSHGGFCSGNLEPSDVPGSTMYTLEEVYNKIDTIYAANNRTIVSQYITFSLASGNSLTVMTVPADRIFILTDLFGNATAWFKITENGNEKLQTTGSTFAVSFNSGIPFAPNSTIGVLSTFTTTGGTLTISGYYIDSSI